MALICASVILIVLLFVLPRDSVGAAVGQGPDLSPQADQHAAPVRCQEVSPQRWNHLVRVERRIDGRSRSIKRRPVCRRDYLKFKAHVQRVKRREVRRLRTDPHYAIHRAFAPLGREAEARKVARCESRFNRFATNGQYRGLFQLSALHRSFINDWTHAYQNAKRAADIVRGDGGWGQWECQP